MGLKPEDRPEYHQGTEAHLVIQQHVSGKKKDPRLEHLVDEVDGQKIPIEFPIVEEKDFDERCKFNVTLKELFNVVPPEPGDYRPRDEYNIIGFFDGINKPKSRLLEIKTSSTPWGITKFIDLMQRKIYGLAIPLLKETVCISGYRDMSLWQNEPPKFFTVPMRPEEKREALKWILGGIEIIESGKFDGGLDENGKCTDPRCYYGVNCSFR